MPFRNSGQSNESSATRALHGLTGLLIRHFWRRWSHFHHVSEELILVPRGEPTIRLRDGDRQLREGDVVPLPRGPSGGHQLRNESTAAARVLIVSTNSRPDVAEYPETGKVGLLLPESDEWEFHRRSEAVPHSGPD